MQPETPPAGISKLAKYAGWTLTALPAVALLMSGGMKLMHGEMVTKGFAELGYLDHVIVPLGIVEVLCAFIYLVPQTAVLGAILVTGYLGGATATHLRLDQPFIAPVIMGMIAWCGLFLRDPRLRALLPLRKV